MDVTVTASTDRSCMLAAWLVGTEHLDERDSGEICLFEIDADAVGEHSTTARVGIKAHHDPRLTTDMTEVVIPVGRGQAHTWSARWDKDGVRVACEGQVIYASAQRLDQPLQLMVDLFEIGPASQGGDPGVPTGDDLDPDEQLILDATLCPCWSWTDQEHLWSGKHHRTGVNLQVGVDHHGCLRWVSDPLPGATHDAAALRASHVPETLGEGSDFAYIGDKGYVGLGMLTPTKKPPGGELTDEQKGNNRILSSVRVVVERAIANLKSVFGGVSLSVRQ